MFKTLLGIAILACLSVTHAERQFKDEHIGLNPSEVKQAIFVMNSDQYMDMALESNPKWGFMNEFELEDISSNAKLKQVALAVEWHSDYIALCTASALMKYSYTTALVWDRETSRTLPSMSLSQETCIRLHEDRINEINNLKNN